MHIHAWRGQDASVAPQSPRAAEHPRNRWISAISAAAHNRSSRWRCARPSTMLRASRRTGTPGTWLRVCVPAFRSRSAPHSRNPQPASTQISRNQSEPAPTARLKNHEIFDEDSFTLLRRHQGDAGEAAAVRLRGGGARCSSASRPPSIPPLTHSSCPSPGATSSLRCCRASRGCWCSTRRTWRTRTRSACVLCCRCIESRMPTGCAVLLCGAVDPRHLHRCHCPGWRCPQAGPHAPPRMRVTLHRLLLLSLRSWIRQPLQSER